MHGTMTETVLHTHGQLSNGTLVAAEKVHPFVNWVNWY